MPFPATESLSVAAPMLYFMVRLMPLSKSTMKNRLSFCTSVGFGTFTIDINFTSDSLNQALGLWPLVFAFSKPRSRVDPQRPKTQDHYSARRHRRLPLRQIHQTNISSLRLKIKITRAPIDSRQQHSGY